MSILIGGQPLQHVHPHLIGIEVRGYDEHVLDSGDQVLAPPHHPVEVVGGVGENLFQLAQGVTCIGVHHLKPKKLIVEKDALGQSGIVPPDGKHLAFHGQGGVHVLNAGQLQKDQAFVNPAGFRMDRLPVQIEGPELREKVRRLSHGLYPQVAPYPMGVDHPSDFDIL